MSGNQHACPRKFKFFRVLLPGFSSKLSIPQKFVKYFIENNSAWATIMSPLGKSWNVKISGDGKSLHFEEGWKRFAIAHRLSLGDFLVFKHIGGLVFDVTIFDQSTCERDYNVIDEVAVDSVDPGQGEKDEKEFERSTAKTTPSCGRTTVDLVMEHEPRKHQQTAPSMEKEEQTQIHKAKGSATKGCKRRSHFEVTVRPKDKYCMRIPADIIRSNGLSSVDGLFLRDPKGHLWPAKLLHYDHACSLLGAGWRDFRVANSLEVGDACVFELKTKNEMIVQIHRRGVNYMTIPEDDNRGAKGTTYGKTNTLHLQQKRPRSRGTLEPDPQFMSTIVPSNLIKKGYLNIPKSIMSSVHLSAEREAVLVDPNSRRWPAKIVCRKSGKRFHIGRGWQEFCCENNVEVGDVCVFSFKSQERKATLQVDVIKSKVGAK